MEDVNLAVQFLRTGRRLLGWSTAEVASRIRAYAESIDDPITLTQQAVSKFENERAKSVPRWMRFFRHLVMMAELRDDQGLSLASQWEDEITAAIGPRLGKAKAWDLILPPEPALAEMFDALLAGITPQTPADERAGQALLLAQRLPIGLSRLQDLRPAARRAVKDRVPVKAGGD